MNEHDNFEVELAELFRTEQRKQERTPGAYSLAPMQADFEILQERLESHIVSLEYHDDGWTVEQILEGSKQTLNFDEKSELLDALLQQDVAEHADTFTGSVQISGRGDYFQLVVRDDERNEENDEESDKDPVRAIAAALQPGEYLIGQLEHDRMYVTHDEGRMLVQMHIIDVTLHNADGSIQSLLEPGIVITTDEFEFHKIITHDLTHSGEQVKPRRPLDVALTLKEGGILQEFYNDIENELNHSDYTEQEHEEARLDAAKQLQDCIHSLIKPHQRFALTALSAVTLEGSEVSLYQRPAKYIDSMIIRYDNAWRIIHEFQVYETDEALSGKIVHILPQDIAVT